jgi:replicative DNA helicase
MKVTPQSTEAEMSTLGAMLMSRTAISAAAEIVTADDFYREGHRLIFSALVSLDERGDDVNISTVVDELRRRGQLEQIGGSAYLSACLEECPSSVAIGTYTKTVREKSLRRKAISYADKVSGLAYGGAETEEEILDFAEREVLALSERRGGDSFTPLPELVRKEVQRVVLAAENPGQFNGVATGFDEIDQLTNGLQPANLIILAARPSQGKTALALQIAHNVAWDMQKPVAVFSLEMSRDELTRRLLSSEARVDSHALANGSLNDDEWDAFNRASERLTRVPLEIIDTPQMTTFDMRAQCRRLAQQRGHLALIVVDYIQLAKTAEKSGNRVEELSKIGKSLKALAKEMKCPVLCLSQLSRAVEQREDKRPVLSDLRDSGTIEEDADIVSFIYRPAYYKKKVHIPQAAQWGPVEDDTDNTAEIIFGKNRNGPTGVAKLVFISEFARFENLQRNY